MAGWKSEVLVSTLRWVRFPHNPYHTSWNPTTGSASGGNVRQRQQQALCPMKVVSPSTGLNSPQQEVDVPSTTLPSGYVH